MGLTDIFTVDYDKVKRAYNTLQTFFKNGVDNDAALKTKVGTALEDVIFSMDKGLKKYVDGTAHTSEKDSAASTRKSQFEDLLAAKKDELAKIFDDLLEAKKADKGLRHNPDKQIFKERKEKLIEKLLPKFFKNLCRALDKFKRKLFKDKDKVMRPQDKLEEAAKKVIEEINVQLGRNISARAKKQLLDGASSAGRAAKGLITSVVKKVTGRGRTT